MLAAMKALPRLLDGRRRKELFNRVAGPPSDRLTAALTRISAAPEANLACLWLDQDDQRWRKAGSVTGTPPPRTGGRSSAWSAGTAPALVGAGLGGGQLCGHPLGGREDGFHLGFDGGRVGYRLDGLAEPGCDVGDPVGFGAQQAQQFRAGDPGLGHGSVGVGQAGRRLGRPLGPVGSFSVTVQLMSVSGRGRAAKIAGYHDTPRRNVATSVTTHTSSR